MKKLTARRELFVAHYTAGQGTFGNGALSAIAAGYSPKSAKFMASSLLKEPEVAAAIAKKTAKVLDKLEVTVQRVLKERARLAFFDPRKLFNEDGTPLPIQELDDDTAAVIAGIKLDGKFVGRGKARKWVTSISEYKIPEKNPNLTALEKHLGMYREEGGDAALSIHIHL